MEHKHKAMQITGKRRKKKDVALVHNTLITQNFHSVLMKISKCELFITLFTLLMNIALNPE